MVGEVETAQLAISIVTINLLITIISKELRYTCCTHNKSRLLTSRRIRQN